MKLALRPNGSPPPLDGMMVDISGHPGREVKREGYVEAVGATMWLGPLFAERTGCDLDEVRRLRVEEPRPGVLRIEAQRSPFTGDAGREQELQDDLRRLLDPRTWNLPVR